MKPSHHDNRNQERLRIDKFIVPAGVHDEFVARLRARQEDVRKFPGCLSARVLSQVGGPGKYNVLTVVEWSDELCLQRAADGMQAKLKAEGFDPKEYFSRLGITSDLGVFAVAAPVESEA